VGVVSGETLPSGQAGHVSSSYGGPLHSRSVSLFVASLDRGLYRGDAVLAAINSDRRRHAARSGRQRGLKLWGCRSVNIHEDQAAGGKTNHVLGIMRER